MTTLETIARKMLDIIENSSAHIERGFHGEVIDEAKRILSGDPDLVDTQGPDKDEEIRLHKIRIAKLESDYDKLLKYRFPDEDQRVEWEAFWNILYNEFGTDYAGEVGLLMKYFKLVRNTQFTQQHYEKATPRKHGNSKNPT